MLGFTDPCLLLKLFSIVDSPNRFVLPGVSTAVINALPAAPGNLVEATAYKSAPIELISLPFLKNFLDVAPSFRVGLTLSPFKMAIIFSYLPVSMIFVLS